MDSSENQEPGGEGDTAFNQLPEDRPFPHHDLSRDSQAAAAIRCGSSGTYHMGTTE